jgi:hypothetical protein
MVSPLVMPGLDPGIHDLLPFPCKKDVDGRSSPAMTARDCLNPHSFLFFALTAIAAAAVRFSTPSLE